MNTPNPATVILEDAINRLLRMDPETLTRLGDIEGKVVCVEILNEARELGGPTFYFHPSEGGFRVCNECAFDPDVTISGSLPSFARLALGERVEGVFRAGKMQISGDLDLGQRFQRVLKQIDIDWEEELSRYMGDRVAHQVGRAVRGFFAWRRHAHDKIKLDFAEFVREEARVVPQQQHVDTFMNAVDGLRLDVERLEARALKLQARLQGRD